MQGAVQARRSRSFAVSFLGPGGGGESSRIGRAALARGGGNDTESGGGGNDKVVGSAGADTLNGQGGADTVDSKDGVNGNDSLDGGLGTDTKVTDAT